MSLEETKSLPTAGGALAAKRDGAAWLVTSDDVTLASLREEARAPKALRLAMIDAAVTEGRTAARTMLDVLHVFFGTEPELARVTLDLAGRAALADELLATGVAVRDPTDSRLVVCERGMFWQHQELWLRSSPASAFPMTYTMTGASRHPVRAPKRSGELYRRYIPELSQSLSLRTIDLVTDLERFHAWQNDPRVSFFWELEGSLEMHSMYIHGQLADPHTHPILVCLDDVPFAYTEIYWAKEDRIGPYYASDDYDRGFHALVGDARYRGPHRVAAWMESITHYVFLDDPRTRRIVCEPRATNDKFIGYLGRHGYYRQKEFDFPHKRAALMAVERESFFEQFSP